ncbi:hypothetical protein KUTeg_017762 [Tegillarca granosa]|uniref:Uncharacterized protein n=1 Tax=Tegillarca granosa TaxID=220873 RepID=A0ABQ9EFV2_TEGGR|nr:hypothetical protein KUTeg_017762 [Tegillarca granosa]
MNICGYYLFFQLLFFSKYCLVSDRISESMNIIANEPSLAFFRVQEHVRKSLPQLVEQKHEVENLQQRVQGAGFDTEYAANAFITFVKFDSSVLFVFYNSTVRTMQKSAVHFQNIQDLLKNAMFMKQQIDYKEEKK